MNNQSSPAQASDEPMRRLEIAIAERNHERAKFDRVFQILMSVHGLLGPGQDFTMPDGRVLRFMDPNAGDTLHHLSAAIKSIPDRLAEAQVSPRATADVERNLRAELVNSGALRQYCHNDGSAGFVTAYDFDVTNRFLAAIATTKPGA